MTGRLKVTPFIPPVIALALAGVWLGSQRQSISTLENESGVLQKHIAAARSASAADPSHAVSAGPTKSAKDKEPLDWKKIAAHFAEMQQSGGMGDMRAMIRLQQRLQAMTKEELVTALDEIATLDLPADARTMLEQMLIGPLVVKDPEFALTRYIDRLQDTHGGMGWQLANAMQEWAKKDPATATAWFDQQIAAGKFDSKSLDGRSQARMQFEGKLIATLLANDLAAAGSRLDTLLIDHRIVVLRDYSLVLNREEDQLAFAQLVRSHIPEKDQARILAAQVSRMPRGEGYAKITEYLDRIDATTAERAVCVEEAAEQKVHQLTQKNKISRGDIDSLREWATTQSPGTVDTVTGMALDRAIDAHMKLDFSEAADLAVQYGASSGNDDVLIGFLSERSALLHKVEARVLAEKISDEKRREEILKKLK